MRENPDLDSSRISACLETEYGIRAASIRYLLVGYDLNAFVYEIVTEDGCALFLKIRNGPAYEPGLLIPRALNDYGVSNVVAPCRTLDSNVWCHLDGERAYSVVLYPYIEGSSAMDTGLSDDQWREFGASLRAVHDSGLEEQFRDRLRVETFALPSSAQLRQILRYAEDAEFTDPIATRFADFLRDHAARTYEMISRAEELGRVLQSVTFDLVLCHSDIHAANIIAGEDGHSWMVDWDTPMIAPRERDLLFVVGSRIARIVEPREEDLFFSGYGSMELDPRALIYYRYERIIEDLGEIGKTVLLDSIAGERERESSANLAMRFFAPGADIDHAESVTRTHWPRDTA